MREVGWLVMLDRAYSVRLRCCNGRGPRGFREVHTGFTSGNELRLVIKELPYPGKRSSVLNAVLLQRQELKTGLWSELAPPATDQALKSDVDA